MQGQIEYALALDLERRPRLEQRGDKEIEVHDKNLASENERMMVLFTAYEWGYNDKDKTKKTKDQDC